MEERRSPEGVAIDEVNFRNSGRNWLSLCETDILHRCVRLGLLERKRNLLIRKLRFLHGRLLLSNDGPIPAPFSHLNWFSSSVARHLLGQIDGEPIEFEKLIVKRSQLSATQHDVDLVGSIVTLSYPV